MIEKITEAKFPTRFGTFKVHAFKDRNSGEHLAIVKGECKDSTPVRIHSKCLTGDTFCSLRCDCRQQLESSLEFIEKRGCGIVIYLDQEGRGIGLINKIKAYALQDKGMDTVDANLELGFAEDLRKYNVAVEILKIMGIKKIKLITNNPQKVKELESNGIMVEERIPLWVKPTKYDGEYIETKKKKLGHLD